MSDNCKIMTNCVSRRSKVRKMNLSKDKVSIVAFYHLSESTVQQYPSGGRHNLRVNYNRTQ